ncbi:MerR family transcriptional regulator [Acidovorax sp. CCYZU-2555]|uniref:MerR family transcriptional regulator n=1 Tax=Acidovorax sp. CCYZU-2555 TaxID=2835042 RepID=UPI001BCDA942|nr:MerR family transcriptional regulator [Acidovorax sp. CCYZU-2555]MBS7778187.1 MerR family transcriptional regulator [Acidovorax sp. CCYZU-2555]
MTAAPSPFCTPCEVLDTAALDLAQLAHACAQPTGWVVQRVHEEVLQIDAASGEDRGEWRFSSHTLLRARRIAHLETAFDADPQLAALAADLMEEVQTLRKLLHERGDGRR